MDDNKRIGMITSVSNFPGSSHAVFQANFEDCTLPIFWTRGLKMSQVFRKENLFKIFFFFFSKKNDIMKLLL